MIAQPFLLAALLGLGAFVFSLHGQGGGVLYAPLQTFFGLPFHQASAHSQWFIFLTGLSATIVFRRAARIDWALAFVLESAGGCGAFLGARWSHSFDAKTLETALGLLVLAAGLATFREWRPAPAPNDAPVGRLSWSRSIGGRGYTVSLPRGLALWIAIGVVSGLTGTAGGFLKAPMLILAFHAPVEVAFGTSAFMVSLTALGGVLGHLGRTEADWGAIWLPSLCVVAGSLLGPRLSLRLEGARLRLTLGLLLGAVGAATLSAVWGFVPFGR